MTSAERLIAVGMTLGEGPIALPESRFACVDIKERMIYEGSLDGTIDTRIQLDETPSAIAVTDRGEMIAAVGRHAEIVGSSERIDLPPTPDNVRMNDGKADPVGRWVCGTMADPPQPGFGTLWSFEHGKATPLLDAVTISNGLCWSADGETMFYIDTPTDRIDAFDYDCETGAISNRRVAVEIAEGVGGPDGMTIDAEGGLWVALWGGGAVHRYVDGTLSEVISLPTPFVTCPVFVGPDLDRMLITTASELIPGEQGAGDLYLAAPGVAGAAAHLASTSRVFERAMNAPV